MLVHVLIAVIIGINLISKIFYKNKFFADKKEQMTIANDTAISLIKIVTSNDPATYWAIKLSISSALLSACLLPIYIDTNKTFVQSAWLDI